MLKQAVSKKNDYKQKLYVFAYSVVHANKKYSITTGILKLTKQVRTIYVIVLN